MTGGAGFIGSHLVDALLERGAAVQVVDSLATGDVANVPDAASFANIDIRDGNELAALFAEFRPQDVFHLAAQTSVSQSMRDPVADAEHNILGSLEVMRACAATPGVEYLQFASTGGAIYGEVPCGEAADESWPVEPGSYYGASKAAIEHYLPVFQTATGIRTCRMRYANVYGERQNPHGEAGVVAIFTQRLLDGDPVRLFASPSGDAGGCLRDYIHVSDVVRANLHAAARRLSGIFNVGTGRMTSTRQLLDIIAVAIGNAPRVEYLPSRPGDLASSAVAPAKLIAEHWSPAVDLVSGVGRTVEWFRKRGKGALRA